MVERRSVVSRELRYWQSERRMSRADKLAMWIMIATFVIGLFAVWSV